MCFLSRRDSVMKIGALVSEVEYRGEGGGRKINHNESHDTIDSHDGAYYKVVEATTRLFLNRHGKTV